MGGDVDTPRHGMFSDGSPYNARHTQRSQTANNNGPLYSGLLRFDLQHAHVSTDTLVWVDVPQRPRWPKQDTLSFSARYDHVWDSICFLIAHAIPSISAQDHQPPLYDRSTHVTLRPDTKASQGNLANQPAHPPSGTVPPRCFNCGSYGHTLNECWRTRDSNAIQAARTSLTEARAQVDAAKSDRRYRYQWRVTSSDMQ